MKWLVGILVLVGLSSCLNSRFVRKQQRLQKHIDKFEAEFPAAAWSDTTYIIKNDTLLVEVPKYVFDTMFSSALDTIIIETERFKTQIQIVKDSVLIPQYFVQTEIKEVAVEVPVVDTITVIKDNLVTKTEYIEKIPWWLVVLCVALSVLFVVTYIRYITVAYH